MSGHYKPTHPPDGCRAEVSLWLKLQVQIGLCGESEPWGHLCLTILHRWCLLCPHSMHQHFYFFPKDNFWKKSNKILTVFIFMDTIAQRTVLYIYLSLMFYQPLCWASLLAFPENACPMVLVPKQKVCVSWVKWIFGNSEEQLFIFKVNRQTDAPILSVFPLKLHLSKGGIFTSTFSCFTLAEGGWIMLTAVDLVPMV